ncbi:MAG: ABC-F family ATP-binding cassette domain-containing protein, partial [Clostridia bacterium]|nr:ABC-F family ATP-binding cassette domain-containing protein [Clostridia bacterium]
MINVNNLTIETLTGRHLVEKLSFILNDGDKLAIIGEEGNGKSTILKAIYNKKLIESYCNVSGNININSANIGFLEQKLDPMWDNCDVLEYLLKDSPNGDYNYERYNQIDKAYKIFTKYKLNNSYIDDAKIIGTLSGGEKVKLQLAKLQFLDYDAYFLDEPTNDLDIETLEKLESFMLSTNKPIMFISHDETLLENVANGVLHIEQLIKKSKPKYTIFKGGYNEYVEQRKRLIEHQTQMAYSQRREKEKKEEILRQIKQKVENALVAAKKDPSSGRIIAKKMANIKAQEKRYDEEELIEIPNVEEAIKLVVDESVTLPTKKEVLKLNIPFLTIESKTLSKDVELTIIGPK